MNTQNDAPSAEAMGIATAAWDAVSNDPRWVYAEKFAPKVDEVLARVRREARAEAFEEVATAASRKAMGWSFTIDGEKIASEFVAFQNSIKALAAKERAK